MPLRVLALDIEGGFGGSSRSLFESVTHLDRREVEVEVWCRRPGPIQARYAAIGIPSRVVDLPQASALPRFSRNLLELLTLGSRWLRSHPAREILLTEIEKRFDLVHFNHEGLFLIAAWLRRHTSKPLTMHIRTNLDDTLFARWQVGLATRNTDAQVFITENEERRLRQLGASPSGDVIHNIAQAPPVETIPHPSIPLDRRLRVACLSNYSWLRGIDRLVDIAVELKLRNRQDILFIVAGDVRLRGSLPGSLGRIARNGGTLGDYAVERGVADWFVFLGHVTEPEQVLVAADVLAKPTREDNPWGRDVIEALAAGKPVLSVGSYNRFVESGSTGILLAEFDAHLAADQLSQLADDRDLCRKLGENGRRRVLQLCDGPSRASDLARFWKRVADTKSRSAACRTS